MCQTSVGYDELGVWREDQPGARMHLPWEEMTRVAGYKLDCMTHVDTVLELEHESGHFFEINNAWTGFDDVVRGIGEQIEGLPGDWFERVYALEPDDEAIVVWERGD